MIKLVTDEGGVLLPVKIVPGASRTRYRGELDGRAKFAVAAPPEKGKANAALIAFLATKLGVPKSSITILRGKTTKRKILSIKGITANQLKLRITFSSSGMPKQNLFTC